MLLWYFWCFIFILIHLEVYSLVCDESLLSDFQNFPFRFNIFNKLYMSENNQTIVLGSLNAKHTN